MAKISTFLLFLLLNLSDLLGQNWFVFPPDQQYTFRHSDSTTITNLIFVDSVVGDSYHFNRVVGDCDTCFVPAKLYNRPQFLLKKATRQADETWVLESENEQFLLKPSAAVGSEWLFNPAKNITAKVSEQTTISIFGGSDLLKIISLSDGNTIHLTLNKGIVKFPDFKNGGFFELLGIPKKNVGERIPGVFEIFNYLVGDVFERTANSSLDAGTPSFIERRQKNTVLDKFWQADTLVYKMDRLTQTIYQWSSGPPLKSTSRDTFLQKIHPNFFPNWLENGYPNQYEKHDQTWNGEVASRVSLRQHSVFGQTKMVGDFSEIFQPRCGLFQQFGFGNGEVLACDGCFSFHQAYSLGLGQVSRQAACFEVWDGEVLSGWIKNGDTTGIITPDVVFTKTTDPKLEIEMKITPNPTSDDWQILFPKPLSKPVKVLIFNELGVLQEVKNLSSGGSEVLVEAGHLPSGVYFIGLFGAEISATVRAVKF